MSVPPPPEIGMCTENQVAPLFYDRNADGIPEGWVAYMRESIVSTLLQFSTHRMVADYYREGYLPLSMR